MKRAWVKERTKIVKLLAKGKGPALREGFCGYRKKQPPPPKSSADCNGDEREFYQLIEMAEDMKSLWKRQAESNKAADLKIDAQARSLVN